MEDLLPIIREVIDSGGEFRLFPRGTSMLPLLREGKDSVILTAPSVPRRLQVYFYRRADGSFVLHRCMQIERDGTLVFCGDNQLSLERGIPPTALIAQMSAFYREDHRVSTAQFRYRLWVRLHSVRLLRYLSFYFRRLFQKLFARKEKRS